LLVVISVFLSGCLGIFDMLEDMDFKKRYTARQEYVEKHPELDERIQKLILAGKIDTGMTKEQIKLSSYLYDYYDHRVEPTSKYGADQVWVYKRTYVASDLIKYEYLYFKGNTLIKIEKTSNKGEIY